MSIRLCRNLPLLSQPIHFLPLKFHANELDMLNLPGLLGQTYTGKSRLAASAVGLTAAVQTVLVS